MNLGEALRTALDNLRVHKLRSSLTMLGMVFGVGAVIAMLAIGAGAERQALEMIESLGLRNVLVRAKTFKEDELREIREKSPGVAFRDIAAIEEGVPGVELAAPRARIEPYKVISAEGKSDADVFGVSHHHAQLSGLTVAEGRFLDPLDERQHAQVAVIGGQVRRDLFGFGPAVGQDIKVDQVWLQVVGVLDEGGTTAASFQGVALGSPSREIYVPVTTALRKFENDPLESPLTEIVVRLGPETRAGTAAGLIRGLLDRLHAGAEDFELVVPEALLAQSQRTQRLFNLVMGCIAGISLLVGGIGIMNIMLASVLERTREIGTRRAVGARRKDVRFQFIVESFAISLLGGLAGVVMGVAIARGVAAWAGWETVVTLSSILLASGVAMAVGLASGIYPAVRAARLDPIEALRHE
ncbi:MAG TPA: ABC transporter permease [Thermoanaerobaculia bacterium]|nr:ABC transporter permease [Thermoanaerobaculia bacterium]